jgi:hypothetical protein
MGSMNKQNYLCKKTTSPIEINGDLNKPVWQRVEKSPRFIDVIGGNPGLYDTRAALLWDEKYLYVGFWCEEPYPTAHITQRDGLLWFENDFEIFIDGGDSYYELQVNALNNIYEAFYIWKDAYSKFADFQEFDVFKNDARVFGGNHDRTGEFFWKGSHPRGNRWAFLNWDFPGLKTAVKINGRLNDTSEPSQGLEIEFAFPWSGMTHLANGRFIPPRKGDLWKIFMGRYQKMQINGREESVGWSWDKIGTNDNHYPELFTQIEFSEECVLSELYSAFFAIDQ